MRWCTTMGFAVVCCCRSETCSKIRCMRCITIIIIYRFLIFFFKNIIVVETRTIEHWYHTSPGPGILYIFRTSPTSSSPRVRSLPPPPPLDISRTRFPELDTRHRRRNPPPLETGRRRRRPGTRMPRSACERFSRCRRVFSPKMWVNARAVAAVAPVKIYTF